MTTLFPALHSSLFAIATGFLFGFLLRKATVSRFDVIVGQLLLKDFTVMKVILTAIATGGCGIYLCSYLGWIPTLHLSKTPLLWALYGGAIFGVGMAITGYCPGTAIAALAEGSKDMLTALAGMFFGSFLFSEFSPFLYSIAGEKDPFFQQTFATFFQLPNWVVMIGLIGIWILFAAGMRYLERTKNKAPVCFQKK